MLDRRLGDPLQGLAVRGPHDTTAAGHGPPALTTASGAAYLARLMPPEAQTVLHTWCRQTDWNAPTIVGGARVRLLTADARSILDMSSQAECSNLGHQHPGIVAAPLVIGEHDLADALDLLDRLLGPLAHAIRTGTQP
jgi:hypothetical protein